MDLILLQDTGILPNLHEFLKYEIYDMEPNIGFSVGSRCFVLHKDEHFKVIPKNELLWEKKSGIVRVTGHILFKKASLIFADSSENSNSSASSRLVSELSSFPVRLHSILQFLWNILLRWIISDKSRSLPVALKSKKMPENKDFLEVFTKKYNVLHECGVIPDPKKKIKYKVTHYISKQCRHAVIGLHNQTHFFVLELISQRFAGGIYNSPNMRCLSPEKMLPKYDFTIETSAHNLFHLAIKTVAKMGDYNVFNNNSYNFVQKYLHSLDPSTQPAKNQDGQVTVETAIFTRCFRYIYPVLHFLIPISGFFKEELFPNALWPISNALVVVQFLFLVFLSRYLIMDLFSSVLILMLIYVYFNRNVVIFHTLSLYSVLLAIRVLRLKRSSWCILLMFLKLALVIGFISSTCFSVSILTSVVMALYTALFGAWSAIGFFYNHNSAIILPCVMMTILIESYTMSLMKGLATTALAMLLLSPVLNSWKQKLWFEPSTFGMLIAAHSIGQFKRNTPDYGIGQFIKDNLGDEMIYTHCTLQFFVLGGYFVLKIFNYFNILPNMSPNHPKCIPSKRHSRRNWIILSISRRGAKSIGEAAEREKKGKKWE